MSFLSLCARAAVAAPFLVQGFDAATAPHAHRGRAAVFAPVFAPVLAKAGIELDDSLTDLSSRALGLAYLAAGAALAAGIAPRLAAAGLSLAHVPVCLANHPFWQHSASERRSDAIGIAQGAAMIGGAVLAAVSTPARRAGL